MGAGLIPASSPLDPRRIVVDQLVLNAAAAEAVAALRERGLRALLLKGPVTARWLYDTPSERHYQDIDLMVSPQDLDGAKAVLAGLGYENAVFRAEESAPHASSWIRRGRWPAVIDLHHTLFWVTVEPTAAWSLLTTDTEEIVLDGTCVEVPGVPQRAMLLALHAASDGPANPKPLNDLALALARLEHGTWEAAFEMARRLEVTDAFTAGLRLLGDGDRLANRLGAGQVTSVDVHLRAVSAPDTALGFQRLFAPGPLRRRLRYLAGELVPSPAMMRRWQPVAERGPLGLGLLLAYLWRPLWLIWKAPRGVIAWREARRRAGQPPSHPEPSHTETSHPEPSPTETSPTETSPTETSHTETSSTETSPTETSPTETSHTETSHTETSSTETSPTETSDTETSHRDDDSAATPR